MNSGIGTPTGHPSIQNGFLQFKQRVASSIACSFVYPKETSSKFLFLTLGSCSGILTLFGDILGIILHLPLNYKYDLHSHLLDVLLL